MKIHAIMENKMYILVRNKGYVDQMLERIYDRNETNTELAKSIMKGLLDQEMVCRRHIETRYFRNTNKTPYLISSNKIYIQEKLNHLKFVFETHCSFSKWLIFQLLNKAQMNSSGRSIRWF